jgi:short-subunit dehydrogenase
VTGAAGGLGGYIARALAAEGVNLALSDLPGADLELLLADVRAAGVQAVPVAADLSVASEAKDLVAAAEAALGPIDILVNNAGLEGGGPFEQLDFDELEKTINVNLLAVVLLTRAALPGMLERGNGHVVTISSVAGKMALAYLAPYSATKYGVAALMRALAAELDDGRVGFSTIFPGAISKVGMAAAGVDAGTTGARARLVSRPPEKVGEAVVSAIRDGRAEVVVSAQPVKLPAALHAVAPGLAIRLMRGAPKKTMTRSLRALGRM